MSEKCGTALSELTWDRFDDHFVHKHILISEGFQPFEESFLEKFPTPELALEEAWESAEAFQSRHHYNSRKYYVQKSRPAWDSFDLVLKEPKEAEQLDEKFAALPWTRVSQEEFISQFIDEFDGHSNLMEYYNQLSSNSDSRGRRRTISSVDLVDSLIQEQEQSLLDEEDEEEEEEDLISISVSLSTE